MKVKVVDLRDDVGAVKVKVVVLRDDVGAFDRRILGSGN